MVKVTVPVTRYKNCYGARKLVLGKIQKLGQLMAQPNRLFPNTTVNLDH